MKLKISPLVITASLFLGILLLTSSCGKSKKEKRWAENRKRDSIAAVTLLDSTFQAHQREFEEFEAGIKAFQKQVESLNAFSYEPKNPRGKISYQARGYTDLFIPKDSPELDTTFAKNAYELQLNLFREDGKVTSRVISPLKIEGGDYEEPLAQDYFLVKDRVETGVWSEDARKKYKEDVLSFMNQLPSRRYLWMVQNKKNERPTPKGLDKFDSGYCEQRFSFFDIQEQKLVGHYYVSASSSQMVFPGHLNWQQTLDDDLYGNYHKHSSNAYFQIVYGEAPEEEETFELIVR